MSDLERKQERRARVRRIILLVVTGLVLIVIAALGTVGLFSSQRASNERDASTSLKTLSSAEADFRANDRDWNHVNDFWTADAKGLYTLTSAAVPGARANSTTDPSIKLIELSLAAADADESFFPAGGENLPLKNFAGSREKGGYWYVALVTDLTLKGSLEMTYKVDTEGTPAMGSVHNTSKFGFASFPDSPSAGKYVFIVNENNTIFRSATSTTVRKGKAVPPGVRSLDPVYLSWPNDQVDPQYHYGRPQ